MSESTKYISCYLVGGLGNQLFQIFATMAYGIQNKRAILFPYSEVLTTGKHRPTYWNSFLYCLYPFTTNNKKFSDIDLNKFNTIRESNYTSFPYFDFSNVLKTSNNILLFGYFQSYLYFDNCYLRIKQILKISEQKNAIFNEFNHYFMSPEKEEKLISMHFRLGDYKYIQECHPVLPIEYYRLSLQHICYTDSDIRSYKVLYFCEKEDNDEINSMLGILKPEFPNITWVKADDAICDWKQLLLMSCCHHNIIANSTFSWWGAYFNENPNKIICYPATWFGNKMIRNVCDLFPPDWEKIEF